MAVPLSRSLDNNEFKHLMSTSNNGDKIENIDISNFTLPIDELKNVTFSNTTWNNINASGKKFENIKFQDCELSNLNFKKTTLINVSFNNCNLKNVIMNNSTLKNVTFTGSHLISTDPNIDNSYIELDINKVVFKNTELQNIGFYKSKGVFIFEDSKLNDVSGQSLKSGSSIHFNNIDAFDIDFSRSDLSILEIKNSRISQSKTNNCSIDKLILEDSILDYPISQGNRYGSVTANNTGNVVISGTPTKNTLISNCPKDTRIIMVGGDDFENIEINDCSPDEIIFFKSKGKYVSIKNANIYTMDFRVSEIEHLKLDNIHIKTQLYYDSSIIKKLEATHISFGENIEHTHEDSNIVIEENKTN